MDRLVSTSRTWRCPRCLAYVPAPAVGNTAPCAECGRTIGNPMRGAGDPGRCAGCGVKLRPHNVTRACEECKLIVRNRRLDPDHDSTGSVTRDEAIATIAAVLGGRVVHDTQPDRRPR